MAVAFVKNITHDNGGSSSATCVATFASASAVGNAIVVGINWDGTSGGTITGISDGHNTYVRMAASSIGSATAGNFEWWVCRNNNYGGGALTVTVTQNASRAFLAIDCIEISGQDTGSDGDAGSGLAVSSATANADINGTALTSSGAGGMLFVGAQFASNSAGCQGASGYTTLNSGGGLNMTDAYKAVGAGSQTPQIHNGGTTQNCVISALIIKAAAAAFDPATTAIPPATLSTPRRPRLAAAIVAGAFFAPPPPPIIPAITSPAYAATVARPKFAPALQQASAWYSITDAAAAVPELTPPSFPDRVGRPRFGTAQHLAFAANLDPIPNAEVPTFFGGSAPVAVRRPRVAPSALDGFSWSRYTPPETAPTQPPPSVRPDRLRRPSLAVALHQAVAAVLILDEPQFYEPIVPGRLDRPKVRPSAQQFAPVLAPKPERPVPHADSLQPDRLPRRLYPTTAQQALAFAPIDRDLPQFDGAQPSRLARPFLAPALQQALALAPVDRPVPHVDGAAPVAVRRPALAASSQQAVAAPPQPPDPRTTQHAEATYPPSVRRPALLTGQQQALADPTPSWFTAPPAPDLADSVFPSAVGRPFLRAHAQQALAAGAPIDRPAPHADALAPARVVRPALGAGLQQAFAWVAIDRPIPQVDGAAPVAVRRPTFAPAAQQALAWTATDRQAPEVDGFAPERVLRPSFLASRQQALASPPLPPDARTVPWSEAIAPVSVRRPRLATASQQAFADETQAQVTAPPAPELTPPIFPGAVRHPMLATSAQWFSARSTIADRPFPQVDGYAPTKVARPAVLPNAQLAFAAPVYPDARQVPWSDALGPASVRRPRLPTAQQQAYQNPTVAALVAPDAAPSLYPAAVRRPTFAAAEQRAFTTTTIVERPVPQVDGAAPVRVERPAFPAARQLAFTTSPQPESARVFADAVVPARVVRPSLASSAQQGPAALPPLPQTLVVPYSAAVAPAAIDRRQLPTALRQAFVDPTHGQALVVLPEIAPPVFPSSVPRARRLSSVEWVSFVRVAPTPDSLPGRIRVTDRRLHTARCRDFALAKVTVKDRKV